MRIRTPSRYFVYPAGYGGDMFFRTFPGMGRLGQDDSDAAADDSSDTIDTSSLDSLAGSTLTPLASGSLSTTLTDINIYGDTYSGGLAPASSSNLNSYVTGAGAPTTTQANGTAQILTAAGIAAGAAAKGITAASGPYQVPGTSLVYNPATGQIVNAAGSIVGTAALPSATSVLSYLPLLIGAGLLVFLLQSMEGRR